MNVNLTEARVRYNGWPVQTSMRCLKVKLNFLSPGAGQLPRTACSCLASSAEQFVYYLLGRGLSFQFIYLNKRETLQIFTQNIELELHILYIHTYGGFLKPISSAFSSLDARVKRSTTTQRSGKVRWKCPMLCRYVR